MGPDATRCIREGKVAWRMGLIQHKREAYWFYRFLSLGYDRWVNPLFWTAPMRDRALDVARLDDPGLETLDAGAGTGFTTEGIVRRVAAEKVTMLDQSPHQLAKARAKPALAACRKLLGDAERLPFPDASFDRYVSAGSIEYWPDPQRGVAEAHRVLKPGGVGVVIGPVKPANPILRRLSETWMLFPSEDEYRAWFAAAGFEDVRVEVLAPDWYRGRSPYGVAIAGTRGGAPHSAPAPAVAEDRAAPMTLADRARFAGRFVIGSAAGFVFVPIGAVLALRARLARRR
jgi:MPBQ/MSBQ methyltransferase